MKKAFCLLVLAFLATSLLINAFVPLEAGAENNLPIHNINSGRDFSSIQEAINDIDTLDGHTIQVDEGVYREHLDVNKTVKLVGENKFNTSIDGEGGGTVIYVTADNVEITGFTIQNSSSSLGGIYIDNSDGANISHNNIREHELGICLNSSSDNVLFGNNITDNYSGVRLDFSSENVISGNNLSNDWDGIRLQFSSDNVISGNNLSFNQFGVYLKSSSSNVLSGNTAMNNSFGIWLNASSHNTLLGNYVSNSSNNGFRTAGSSNNNFVLNTASDNYLGVWLESSGNNTLFHNNFMNNTIQARVTAGFTNVWDKGYPTGGNFWSGYNVTDLWLGSRQKVTGSDGIGDDPYTIDANNTDHYPLMAPAHDFSFTWEGDVYHVPAISNSTIMDFNFNGSARMIKFKVAGPDNTTGFCRVAVPYKLINGPYLILVEGQEARLRDPQVSNGTHAFLYFTYLLSTREVLITSKLYYELIEKYNNLARDYESLNSTFAALDANYTQLRNDYDSLKATHNELAGNLTELLSKYNETVSELAGIRNLLYAFVATTLVGVGVLLPFSVKYYRVSNAQKEIIEAYNPLDIARALFRNDVERRGAKIERFEEKYGVKIRPRETLEDAIESMKPKKKVKR